MAVQHHDAGAVARERLATIARPRTFARGQVLCNAGEVADSLHLVVSGSFAAAVSLESGETAIVDVLVPGDYVGELALLDPGRRRRRATVTALTRAGTLTVGAAAYDRLRETDHVFEEALVVLLADRVERLNQRLLEARYVDVEHRVYRRLLDVAAATGGDHVVVPLTQDELAGLTGGSRQSVNRALRRLVAEGVLVVGRGRIEVLDLDRLRAACVPPS